MSRKRYGYGSIEEKLDRILKEIRKCLRCCKSERGAGIIVFGQAGVTMSKSINIGANTTATVVYTDDQGVSDPIFSVPVWAATPDGIVTLAPAADGMTCVATGVAAGDVSLTATAEGDSTPGANTIVATAALNVKAAEDSKGEITFS